MRARSELRDQLFEANCIITILDAMDRSALNSVAVTDGYGVYGDLLTWQRNRRLADSDLIVLHSVIDRLKARLRFFGISV